MIKRLLKHSYRAINKALKKKQALAVTPSIENKKFLFIGGLHRSGTSILHRLLREHPQTSGFDNTGVMEDEGQHLQSVFASAHHYGGPGRFAFNEAAHLTEQSELINQANRDKLLREWGAYYDFSKDVLLEKSPPNLVRSRFFRELFPSARFVFIVRHPIAVTLATEKWSNSSLLEGFQHWQQAHAILLDDIRDAGDCLLIRYEDLVAKPEQYLDAICDLLEIPYFSAKENVENHNKKYFSQWQAMHPDGVAQQTFIQGADLSLLNTFGYQLDSPYVIESRL